MVYFYVAFFSVSYEHVLSLGSIVSNCLGILCWASLFCGPVYGVIHRQTYMELA